MTTDSDPLNHSRAPDPPSPPPEPAGKPAEPTRPDQSADRPAAQSADQPDSVPAPDDSAQPVEGARPDMPLRPPAGGGTGPSSEPPGPPSGGPRPGFGQPPPRPASSRLMRSTSDKVLTGVCSGLARHTGIDPILFRIGFIALVFAGGTGVLLYVALAVLMPRDDGQPVWSRGTGMPRDVPEIRPEMRIGDRERDQTVAFLSAAHTEGQLDLAEYDERVASAFHAKIASDLTQLTSDLALADRLHPAPFSTTPARGRSAPPAAPRGPRSPVPGVTVAILLIGAGLVAFGERYANWSLDPSIYFGIAVALIGAALVVTAFGPWRRSKGGLITLGVILSFGLFVTSAVDSQGGFGEPTFGERSYRPTSVEQVRDNYRVLMGQGTLDLSAVQFSAEDPIEIQVDVTMGNFEILVPREVDLQVNGDASFGSVSAFGDRDSFDGYYQGSGAGPDVGDNEPELILDVDVRFGNAEVTRVG